MSKKRRAIEKQKKHNSEEQKRKRKKKEKYKSPESKQKWEDKKARKEQSQYAKRESQGVSASCPLRPWDKPSTKKCYYCDIITCKYHTTFKRVVDNM